MSRLVLTLAVGRAGREMLSVSGPILAAYARRVGAEFRAVTDPSISPAYPLGAKFQAGQYIRAGWERVLFLDADAIPAPDCPDLFEMVPETHVGLYDDRPDNPHTAWMTAEYHAMCASQGWATSDPGTCYNTGVIVASARHAMLFDPPQRDYPIKHCSEQNIINLNVARHAIPIRRLPPEANWQWWARKGDFEAPGKWVYHLSGASQREAGGTDQAGRLKLVRETALRLYPDRGPCRHRSDLPTAYAGGCCNDTAEVTGGAHEYDCALHDAGSCCTGLPLSELGVRRCRVCPDHSPAEAIVPPGAPGA